MNTLVTLQENNTPAQWAAIAASMVGREHQRLAKNNQDSYACEPLLGQDLLIAVVCDGCSSGAHSEVGAKLGAKWLVQTISQLYPTFPDTASAEFWQRVRQQMLGQIRASVPLLGDPPLAILRDYFLFTLVGAIVTPKEVTLFSLGDGVILLNGAAIPLGPFANNAPPYLAYGLGDHRLALSAQFQIHRHLPTAEVESLVLGSDGVQDLMAIADRPLPGQTELVGPIDQFWQDERYWQNPDLLRRRLTLINREVTRLDRSQQRIDRHMGLLPDDTTLIVLRRR